MNVRRAAVIALAVLVASAAGVSALRTHGTSDVDTIGAGNPSFAELSDRFTQLADRTSAVHAFDVLREAALPPGIDLHLLGHVVGDALYRQRGIEGIEYCTQEFRNACSHTIVIGALNEFGTTDGTIEKIRAACEKAPGGTGAYTMCFHGLGHGVFAYFQYDLPKAVAFCERFGTPAYGEQEYLQCVGGIIMELTDGGGHDRADWLSANVRYFDPADPLAPCDREFIPEETKPFCYSYLTPHLFEAAGASLGAPDPATFSTAFSYCDPIADASLRRICWGGFGKEFIPLAGARDIRRVDQYPDSAYQQAIAWCALAQKTEAQNECVGQALASIFWGGENDPSASFRFCSLVVDSGMQSFCYDKLALNISIYSPGDEQRRLCTELPAAYRDACSAADANSL